MFPHNLRPYHLFSRSVLWLLWRFEDISLSWFVSDSLLSPQEGLGGSGPAVEEGRSHRGDSHGVRSRLQDHSQTLRRGGQPTDGCQQSSEWMIVWTLVFSCQRLSAFVCQVAVEDTAEGFSAAWDQCLSKVGVVCVTKVALFQPGYITLATPVGKWKPGPDQVPFRVKSAINSLSLFFNSVPDDISLWDKDSGWWKIAEVCSYESAELLMFLIGCWVPLYCCFCS